MNKFITCFIHRLIIRTIKMTPTFVPIVFLLLGLHAAVGQNPEEGYESQYTSSPEELFKVPMSFTGDAPDWLNGTLMRVGPAMFELEGSKSYVTNCLDGFAKIALWRFLGNGSLLFSTRFINSTYRLESLERKKFTSNIFFSSPVPELTSKEIERSQKVGIDNMDINIVDYLDADNNVITYGATNDAWPIYEVSLDQVVTNRKITPQITDAEDKPRPGTPEFIKLLSTAHPLPEPNTKNKINILLQAALNPGEKNLLKVVRIKSLQHTEVIASIEIPEIPLLHSFSVTQKKVAILMNPLILNVTCMVNNQGNCYTWKTGNDNITLWVVDLRTGSFVNIPVFKTFVYHHINAFDVSDDELVLDLATHNNSAAILDKFNLFKVKNMLTRNFMEPRSDMKRLRVFLSSNYSTLTSFPSPTPASVIASTLEYPVINEMNRSLPYCYVYGIVEKVDGMNLGAMAVAKKDVCNNRTLHSDALYQKLGWYPHEPTFVPAPYVVAEDDGILLVPFTSGQEMKTHLVILRAADLTLLATAKGPILIPPTQHGRYVL